MHKKETNNISRREAIAKTGKYAALTAAATFLILSPKQSQASSPTDPGWGKANPDTSRRSEENMNKKKSKA